MKKEWYRVFLLMIMTFAGALLIGCNQIHAAAWQPYSLKIMGYAKKQRILKYDGSNWGNYEEIYENKYFKDTKSTKYKYNHQSRVMVIRYLNKSKSPEVNTNVKGTQKCRKTAG